MAVMRTTTEYCYGHVKLILYGLDELLAPVPRPTSAL